LDRETEGKKAASIALRRGQTPHNWRAGQSKVHEIRGEGFLFFGEEETVKTNPRWRKKRGGKTFSGLNKKKEKLDIPFFGSLFLRNNGLHGAEGGGRPRGEASHKGDSAEPMGRTRGERHLTSRGSFGEEKIKINQESWAKEAALRRGGGEIRGSRPPREGDEGRR